MYLHCMPYQYFDGEGFKTKSIAKFFQNSTIETKQRLKRQNYENNLSSSYFLEIDNKISIYVDNVIDQYM